MKLFYIGAAVAAGAGVLYSRSHRKQSRLVKAAKIAAAAIAGRRMLFSMFTRAVRQNFQLRACNMRLHRMEDRLKAQAQ
jgi:hypothetical protein